MAPDRGTEVRPDGSCFGTDAEGQDSVHDMRSNWDGTGHISLEFDDADSHEVERVFGCRCPYEILQVGRPLEAEALKQSYRRLALLLHPDKNKCLGAEQAFKAMSAAYQELIIIINDSGQDMHTQEDKSEDLSEDELFSSFFPEGLPILTDQMLYKIANKLGQEWYPLGHHLGIPHHRMEEFAGLYVSQWCPLRMLYRWYEMSRGGEEDTKLQLVKALEDIKKHNVASIVIHFRDDLCKVFPHIYSSLLGDWEELATMLGLPEEAVTEILVSSNTWQRERNRDCRVEMLRRFQKLTGGQALFRLADGLQLCGRNDLVESIEGDCNISFPRLSLPDQSQSLKTEENPEVEYEMKKQASWCHYLALLIALVFVAVLFHLEKEREQREEAAGDLYHRFYLSSLQRRSQKPKCSWFQREKPPFTPKDSKKKILSQLNDCHMFQPTNDMCMLGDDPKSNISALLLQHLIPKCHREFLDQNYLTNTERSSINFILQVSEQHTLIERLIENQDADVRELVRKFIHLGGSLDSLLSNEHVLEATCHQLLQKQLFTDCAKKNNALDVYTNVEIKHINKTGNKCSPTHMRQYHKLALSLVLQHKTSSFPESLLREFGISCGVQNLPFIKQQGRESNTEKIYEWQDRSFLEFTSSKAILELEAGPRSHLLYYMAANRDLTHILTFLLDFIDIDVDQAVALVQAIIAWHPDPKVFEQNPECKLSLQQREHTQSMNVHQMLLQPSKEHVSMNNPEIFRNCLRTHSSKLFFLTKKDGKEVLNTALKVIYLLPEELQMFAFNITIGQLLPMSLKQELTGTGGTLYDHMMPVSDAPRYVRMESHEGRTPCTSEVTMQLFAWSLEDVIRSHALANPPSPAYTEIAQLNLVTPGVGLPSSWGPPPPMSYVHWNLFFKHVVHAEMNMRALNIKVSRHGPAPAVLHALADNMIAVIESSIDRVCLASESFVWVDLRRWWDWVTGNSAWNTRLLRNGAMLYNDEGKSVVIGILAPNMNPPHDRVTMSEHSTQALPLINPPSWLSSLESLEVI